MTEKKVTKTETEQSAEDAAPACHHHGWLGKHFCMRNFKKLGVLGIVLFVLHILFHVVEILLIPTILMWLGHNH